MTTTQSTTDNTNYVTPEEAYEKLCPQREMQRMWCDGPKCMAWRWRFMRYEEDKNPEIDAWPAIYSTTNGYCGVN